MAESAKEIRAQLGWPEPAKEEQDRHLNQQLAMLGVYQQKHAPYAEKTLEERLRIVEAERDMWRLEAQRGCWPTNAQKEIDNLRLANCHAAAQLKFAMGWKDIALEAHAKLEELHSDAVVDLAMRHTYQIFWSEEDRQFVGVCSAHPSVSHLADRPVDAYLGILGLIADIEREPPNEQNSSRDSG